MLTVCVTGPVLGTLDLHKLLQILKMALQNRDFYPHYVPFANKATKLLSNIP